MREIAGIGLVLGMSELKDMFNRNGFTMMLDGFMENSVDNAHAAGLAMRAYHDGTIAIDPEAYDLEKFTKVIEMQFDLISALVDVVIPKDDEERASQTKARESLASLREDVRKDIRGEG